MNNDDKLIEGFALEECQPLPEPMTHVLPEDWRWLEEGEVILRGDVVCDPRILPVRVLVSGGKLTSGHHPVRRKVDAGERHGGWDVGMPASLLLEQFGSLVWDAFGSPSYLVGSAMSSKTWRDADVRLILDDKVYADLGLGDPADPHCNAKWVSLTLDYATLGQKLTGLPIDFQIQQMTAANKEYTGPRSALGLTAARMVPYRSNKETV